MGPVNSYRVPDLFSGIGGFSLGLERAGMETVAFCEAAQGELAR
jgi:site-specific DNA-cytosine methylase